MAASLHRASWPLGVGLILVAGAALRLLAARCDLWLDEIWSLDIASRLTGMRGVYAVKHDNNHLLNTLFMVWVGQQRPDFWYRLPSVLSGVGTVAVAAALAPRSSRAARLCTLLLFASSMTLVARSSEARGYALSIFFALCSLLILERWLVGPRGVGLAAAFWLCTVLAVLAHLSAATAYAAIACYWLAARMRSSSPGRLLREALWLHAVPVLCLGAHYLLFARVMHVGGGAEAGLGATLATTAAWTLGVADASGRGLAAAVCAAAGALALYRLWRARDPRAVLFAAALLLPVLALVAMHIKHAAPRYLLVSATFLLLLLGTAAGAWLQRGGAPRLAAAALLAIAVSLNLLGDLDLIRLGRGRYREALDFIVAHSPPGPITVTSDHDFRNRVLIAHYARLQPQGFRVVYLGARTLPPAGSEWLVLHRVAGQLDVPARSVLVRGVRYDQQLALPCSLLAGIGWYLYARSPAAATR